MWLSFGMTNSRPESAILGDMAHVVYTPIGRQLPAVLYAQSRG